jgi:hypothetical protein
LGLPDPGTIRFIGSGTLASTSQITIAYNDLNGNDRGNFLRQMTSGIFVIKSNSNSGTNFATFNITSLTDNYVISSPTTSYVTLVIDTASNSGTWSFATTDSIVINFSKTGTSGTSGTRGTSGTSGTSGTRGTSGTSGVNGTSGTTGTSGTSGARSVMNLSYTGSSLSLTTGLKTLPIGTPIVNLGWQQGTRVRIWNSATTYMEGQITTVITNPQSANIDVNVDYVVGTGTYGIWYVGIIGDRGLLSLEGTTNNGIITLNGSAPNGTVESNLRFDNTTNTLTLIGNLVINTATASSGVFSHYFQVTVNGNLMKIPLYY